MKYWIKIAIALLASGCSLAGTNSDIRSVEVGLATAVTLGQAASLALEAVENDENTGCVSVVSDGEGFPREAEVVIEYGPDCPLPLGGEASGRATVVGEWASADSATLDLTFVNAQVDGRDLVLASATTIAVTRTERGVRVEYTGAQASVTGPVSLAGTSVWEVTVDDGGTPSDDSDDTILVDGSTTAAGAGAADVLTVDGVVISRSCELNPTSGEASITEAGLFDIRVDEVFFHAECDGTAELESVGANRRSVDLDFLE